MADTPELPPDPPWEVGLHEATFQVGGWFAMGDVFEHNIIPLQDDISVQLHTSEPPVRLPDSEWSAYAHIPSNSLPPQQEHWDEVVASGLAYLYDPHTKESWRVGPDGSLTLMTKTELGDPQIHVETIEVEPSKSVRPVRRRRRRFQGMGDDSVGGDGEDASGDGDDHG